MDISKIQEQIRAFESPKFRFNPEKHRYTYNGQYMPSVTGINKRWKKPFDRDGISKRVAEKQGKTQEEVLAEWDAKGKASTDLGTEVHNLIEAYWNGEKPLASGKLVVSDEAKRRFSAFLGFRQKRMTNLIPIATELKVFSQKMWFAGTLDLLAYNRKDGYPYIFDWKTNGSFRTDDEHAFDNLLPPFDDLKDNEHNNYSLQLSLYRIILEDEVGLEVKDGVLVHIPPNGANPVIHIAKDFRPHLREIMKPKPAISF